MDKTKTFIWLFILKNIACFLGNFISSTKKNIIYNAKEAECTRKFSKVYRNDQKGRQLVSSAAKSTFSSIYLLNGMVPSSIHKPYFNLFMATLMQSSRLLLLEIMMQYCSVHCREYSCTLKKSVTSFYFERNIFQYTSVVYSQSPKI